MPENITSVLTLYRALARILNYQSTTGLEAFVKGMVMVQLLVAPGFLLLTLQDVKIPLVVLAYLLLESCFVIWLLGDMLMACVNANGLDKRFRDDCSAIATELRLLETPTEKEVAQACMFSAIADHLDEQSVINATVFGVRVNKELAFKIVAGLSGATISATVRSGFIK